MCIHCCVDLLVYLSGGGGVEDIRREGEGEGNRCDG